MSRYYHAVRRPVRRPGAEQFLLIMLLSFAFSVSATRLFLELTGYPQLGGGGLHIAHLLWGGLLLFIAALLPLIFANRWVYRVVALLSGLGIGLFIDEVGKFITQNNDYFYPAAAPIVYAFFLICVLIYLQFSRPTARDSRAELYTALEMMDDILDHDLDPSEKADIEARLRFVTEQKDQPELAQFANILMEYFTQDNLYLAPYAPHRLKKVETRLRALEERHLSQARFRFLLVLGIGALGLVSLIVPMREILIRAQPESVVSSLNPILQNASRNTLILFIRLQILHGLTGLALIVGAILLAARRERLGISFSYFALLVYLTVVNLLLFYYNQFSTIISAVIQFVLLMGALYYRQRYLSSREQAPLPELQSDGTHLVA